MPKLLGQRCHRDFRFGQVVQFVFTGTLIERIVIGEFVEQAGQMPGQAFGIPHPPKRHVRIAVDVGVIILCDLFGQSAGQIVDV